MRRFALVILLTIVSGCNSPVEVSSNPEPDLISQACMDRVSIGGTVREVVRTNQEYKVLIFQRFTKPLKDYWDAHYEDVLARNRGRNPGLTPEEYQKLVRKDFYSARPLKGTEGCVHPEIDFATSTLIGMDVGSPGCKAPQIRFRYTPSKAGADAVLTLLVHRQGECERLFMKNIWVLVPKIPEDVEVRFERQDSHN